MIFISFSSYPKGSVSFFESNKKTKKFLKRKRTCYELPIDILNHGNVTPLYSGPGVEVLFEDPDFIVLNKPPKVHCEHREYSRGDNIISFIRMIRPTLNFINYSKKDRGLLYRLDFETSGVLIFVKNKNLHREMRQNFQKIVKKKIYKAKVKGFYTGPKVLKHTLKSFGPRGERQKVVQLQEEGVTLEVLNVQATKSDKFSTLTISLGKGARHQIRVQLAEVGYPIVGDKLYGGPSEMDERLALHAFSYEFRYQGRFYQFLCPESF